MTLDAIVRILEDSTCGFVRLSPDKVAATVRAADELLGRCEKTLHCLTYDNCGRCNRCKLIADIRKIRGGGGQ